MGTDLHRGMRHGEHPRMLKTVGDEPEELNSAQDGKGKGGEANGKGKDGKGKRQWGMEIKEAEREAVNPRKADVSFAEGSTGPPSAPRMLSRKGVVSLRPENKGDISRRR